MNLLAVFLLESTIKQTTDTTVVVHRIVVVIITPTAISTVDNAKDDNMYNRVKHMISFSAQCIVCHLYLEFVTVTHP